MRMTIDIVREVLNGEVPLEDGWLIWLDAWEYRFKRLVCRIKGHVPRLSGDGYTTPYEKWCDRCMAILPVDE